MEARAVRARAVRGEGVCLGRCAAAAAVSAALPRSPLGAALAERDEVLLRVATQEVCGSSGRHRGKGQGRAEVGRSGEVWGGMGEVWGRYGGGEVW